MTKEFPKHRNCGVSGIPYALPKVIPETKFWVSVQALDMTVSLVPTLEAFRESFAEFSNYAVEVRYPDDWWEPSRDEAETALGVAQQVVAMIREHISLDASAGRGL